MKLSKIALASAALAAIASGSAFAGQIGGSSTTYAKEGLTATTIVGAPTKNYAFASDINAKIQSQKFQLQWTLSAVGEWQTGVAASATVIVPTVYTALTPVVSATLVGGRAGRNFATYATGADVAAVTAADDADLISVNYVDEAGITRDGFPFGTTINAFVTADKKTLAFDINIPTGTGAQYLLKNPRFAINGGTIAALNNVGATKLVDVLNPNTSTVFTATDLGASCTRPDLISKIAFKHFTNNTGTAVLQTTESNDSEHTRGGSANDGNLVTISQALKFTMARGTAASRTNPSAVSGSTPNGQLVNGTGVSAGTTAGYGNFTVPALAAGFYLPAAVAPTTLLTRHFMGDFKLAVNNSSANDTDGATAYGVGANGVALEAVDYNTVAGLAAITTAGVRTGLIDHVAGGNLAVVKFGSALPVGSKIYVVQKAATGQIMAVSAPTVAGQVLVNVPIAVTGYADQATALADLATNGGNMFVEFPGTLAAGAIAQNSTFEIESILTKSQGTDGDQNNNCFMSSAGIGAGIRIDIRNYASRAKFPTGNYTSIVRLINNSETQSADVFAQLIYADGTYGPYGTLPALAPRAVANYTNAQLEALMTTTPPVANPFGTAAVYTQTQGAAVVNRGEAGVGDRVRFVSNTGTTLRIQSYLALPNGSVLDTTNAQGVDFENSTNNRTPSTAIDGQPISQDAINGLAK